MITKQQTFRAVILILRGVGFAKCTLTNENISCEFFAMKYEIYDLDSKQNCFINVP